MVASALPVLPFSWEARPSEPEPEPSRVDDVGSFRLYKVQGFFGVSGIYRALGFRVLVGLSGFIGFRVFRDL